MKRSVAVSVAAVLLSLPLARPATAQEITCASTLAGAIVLQGDLDCAEEGLEAESGLHLDLNGFTIRGELVSEELSEITIVNGVADGLTLLHGTTTLTDVRADSIFLVGGSLDALRVDGPIVMAYISASTVHVRDSRVELYNCLDCVAEIEGSRIDTIDESVSGDLRLVDNDIYDYSGANDELVLTGNRIHGLVELIALWSGRITGNTFTGPDAHLEMENSLSRTQGIEVTENVFSGGKGMFMSLPEVGPYDISNNRFVGSVGTGLTVADWGGTSETVGTITGNRFVDNAGSGMAFEQSDGLSSVTVARNVAARNGEHGIDADGVTDGGGNKAADNGATPECVGVVCSPK